MKLLLVSIAILAAASAGFAHEYWLEPASFFIRPGEKVGVRLFVGDGLERDVEERPYQPEKTIHLFAQHARERIDLKPPLKAGSMPIFEFSSGEPGNVLLAMERDWSFTKLGAVEFEDYLRTDGMEYIIAERARLGESGMQGRERYARFIKALLQVGDKRDGIFRRVLGQKLEIVPLDNPYAKKVGDDFAFSVLFEGRPLAGRTVFADSRGERTQRIVTDKKGRASVKLTRPGMWLIRLVTMRRCETDCAEYEWESFWGALTFGLRDAKQGPAAPISAP